MKESIWTPDTYQELVEKLIQLAEPSYRDFHQKLVPGEEHLLGIRVPVLRKVAKEIAKGDWQGYLQVAQHTYYEETMLQGMVIGSAKTDIQTALQASKQFFPHVTNWAVCDVFCAGMKITRKYKKEVWDFLVPYLHSPNEFDVRLAVVWMMDFYVEEDSINRLLDALESVYHHGYYVKMAVAWALSVCFVKFPDQTMNRMYNGQFDLDTLQKACQKIIESNRVDSKVKQQIRTFRQDLRSCTE